MHRYQANQYEYIIRDSVDDVKRDAPNPIRDTHGDAVEHGVLEGKQETEAQSEQAAKQRPAVGIDPVDLFKQNTDAHPERPDPQIADHPIPQSPDQGFQHGENDTHQQGVHRFQMEGDQEEKKGDEFDIGDEGQPDLGGENRRRQCRDQYDPFNRFHYSKLEVKVKVNKSLS